MSEIKAVCVYCGSSGQVDPRYREAAASLGRGLAGRGITMVYGGGRIGLMGLAADACLTSGGAVIGIIPEFLQQREVDHPGVKQLIVVGSMHERKQRMTDLADAFVVLPGGLGTLDEFFEILTWKQLGLHSKPIILLDAAGYWQKLIELLDHLVDERFVRAEMRALWEVAPDVDRLFELLALEPPLTGEAKTRLA
jgi:uncharacterized protein (TIGR00730 family)